MSTESLAFRRLHEGAFCMPNAWNAGAAKLIESMGFAAVGTTSAGLAWALGREDGVGQVSLEETLANAALVMSGTSLPVSADLENGFGDSPEACAHTITQAAAIGLAGGSIEDSPGTREGAVYEFAHAVERVEAAVEAARPSGFVLTARTECVREDASNLDDVIARLVAFETAGADVLFAPGLSAEHVAEVAGALHKPLNVLVGFAAPAQKIQRLFAAGVRRVSLGSGLSRTAEAAVKSVLGRIRADGTIDYPAAQA